jgi:hypothetical protein
MCYVWNEPLLLNHKMESLLPWLICLQQQIGKSHITQAVWGNFRASGAVNIASMFPWIIIILTIIINVLMSAHRCNTFVYLFIVYLMTLCKVKPWTCMEIYLDEPIHLQWRAVPKNYVEEVLKRKQIYWLWRKRAMSPVVWHVLLIEEALVTSNGELWKVLSYRVLTVTVFWQLHLQNLPLEVGVIPGSFCRLHLKWWSLDLFISDFIKGCEFLVSLRLHLLENDSTPRRNFHTSIHTASLIQCIGISNHCLTVERTELRPSELVYAYGLGRYPVNWTSRILLRFWLHEPWDIFTIHVR